MDAAVEGRREITRRPPEPGSNVDDPRAVLDPRGRRQFRGGLDAPGVELVEWSEVEGRKRPQAEPRRVEGKVQSLAEAFATVVIDDFGWLGHDALKAIMGIYAYCSWPRTLERLSCTLR